MIQHARTQLLILVLSSVAVACGGGGSGGGNNPAPPPLEPDPTPRAFKLGFTPWPYDATTAAVNFVYSEVAAQGDFIAHHLDAGIPWDEALARSAYPDAVEAEISARPANTAPEQRSYLALSPLNGARTAIADYWGDSTGQPLQALWSGREFDSPEVIQAYTNFASDLITRFQPTYFNLGIEVSELLINDQARYDRYVTFASSVSAALRVSFPDLKLMVSVGLKSPDSANVTLINNQLPELIELVDVVGISVYPYAVYDHADKGDPANLPANWLSQITTIANGKPIAIAETGWPAERLEIPSFGLDVDSNEDFQNAYVTALFAESQKLQAEFIVWFALVDYDALWSGALAMDPVARVWRDTGLYDESLNARPALETWQSQLDLPTP